MQATRTKAKHCSFAYTAHIEITQSRLKRANAPPLNGLRLWLLTTIKHFVTLSGLNLTEPAMHLFSSVLRVFYLLSLPSLLQVDVYDEGSYTCSIQTKQQPKTSQVYLIVQGV